MEERGRSEAHVAGPWMGSWGTARALLLPQQGWSRDFEEKQAFAFQEALRSRELRSSELRSSQ